MGRRVSVQFTAICGWEDRPLVAKLQQDIAHLSVSEMEIIRRNGFLLEN